MMMRERVDNKTKRQRDAEILDPNLYPGGLRHKEKPKTFKFAWVLKRKKNILKKDKKN